MGNILDIGLMIAVYIMMKAVSYSNRKESPAVKVWSVICMIITFLFMIGWIATTFGIFRLLQN